jgi:hypothetical protein
MFRLFLTNGKKVGMSNRFLFAGSRIKQLMLLLNFDLIMKKKHPLPILKFSTK